MAIVNYEHFSQFYLENRDKLFMPSGEKNVNLTNVSRWFHNIDTHSPEEIKEIYSFFARTFIEFLRYVSFDEFYAILYKISLQFTTLPLERYRNIYFYIPDVINKSNLWVSLLFLDCLTKLGFIDTIREKIKIVNNYNHLVIDSNNENSLCLLCDDMTYTGNQIFNHFRRKATQKEPDDHIEKYLVISHLSNVASKKLSEVPNMNYFADTVVVNSYITQLKEKYSETHKEMVDNIMEMFKWTTKPINMGRKACNCSLQHIPIYFDHKIADSLSTFDKLLFTGSYPTRSSECEITPLIGGCDDIEELKKLFPDSCTEEGTLDSEVPCYPAFYKKISYTFHGTPLDTEEKNIVSVLRAMEEGHGRRKRKTGKKRKRKTTKRKSKKRKSGKRKRS